MSTDSSICSLVAALCLVASGAFAQSAELVPDNYEEALKLLELGDREGAIEQYNLLLDKLPNHAGAWLDLALLYCEQGEVARAHQIFEHVERQFQPPPAIRELILHYRASGCAPRPAPKGRWVVTLSTGHTSNVNRGLSNPVVELTLPFGITPVRLGDAFNPRASALVALNASFTKEVRRLPGTSWFIGATEKFFPSVQELSQRSFVAGISQQRAIQGWQVESELAVTHLSLDERSHQTGLLGQVGAWAPAINPRTPQFGADLSVSRWRYPHDPLYDNRIIEGRFNMRWVASERVALRASLGRVVDIASNARPGLDREGYSFYTGAQWLLSDLLRADASFRQRRLTDEAVYSPLFGERRHRSTQQQFLAGIQTQSIPGLPGTWRLEWERSASRDNIPLFPYTSRTISVSWQLLGDVF